MKKVRINFWYKGEFHKTKQKGSIDVDSDEFDETDDDNSIAEEHLESAINRGVIDHMCDAGISDFGVISVNYNPKGKPMFENN